MRSNMLTYGPGCLYLWLIMMQVNTERTEVKGSLEEIILLASGPKNIGMNMNKIQDIYSDNLRFMRLVLNYTYDAIDKGQDLWINLLNPPQPSTNIVRRDSRDIRDHREEQIERIQSKGDRFLSELYALSKADENQKLNMYEIGESVGFDEFETEVIVDNLSRAELIKRDKSSEDVSITPYGIMINNGDIVVGYAPVH